MISSLAIPAASAGPSSAIRLTMDVAAQVFQIDAEPRPGRRGGAAVLQQVLEDRLQRVDRHEHVARLRRRGAGSVAHDQRADAEQAPAPVHQRRAAERAMGRRGKDGLRQQILPIAGEVPARGNGCAAHRLRAAENWRSAPRPRRQAPPSCRAPSAQCPAHAAGAAGRSRSRCRSPRSPPGPSPRRRAGFRPRSPREIR